MRKILLPGALALLFSSQAISQASMPYTTCPNVNLALVRAGNNANTGNPFLLYEINTATGAATLVPGGPYKDPMNMTQNLQVNGVGVNRVDGFLYGLSVEPTISTARLLRLDKAYGVTDLGYLPSPASAAGQLGIINTAAGDLDDQGNYWFTAATVNMATQQLTGFFLGKVANVAAQPPAPAPIPVTYYPVMPTASCAALAAALVANLDNSVKDISFNNSSKTLYSYVTYSANGAPPYAGQVAEIRPVVGSNPQQYEVVCSPVVNTHSAETAGTLIDNAGDFFVLLTDGSFGRIGTTAPYQYTGVYIPVATSTGLPNPLRGDLAGCGSAPVMQTWYRDFDGDGFGNPAKPIMSATQPPGYVANNLDCNDYKVLYQDNDGEGWGSSVKVPCGGVWRTGDCNDNDPKIHSLQTFYRDADGDWYGNKAMMIQQCTNTPPAGYVRNSIDCNDADPKVYWPIAYYRDADADGLGDPANSLAACSSTPPAGYVRNKKDTNDSVPISGAQPSGSGVPAPVEAMALAGKTALLAYPNPFGKNTRLQYSLPADAQVTIQVFDVMGRELGLVFSGRRSAGTHYAEYNASALSAGVYYCRMTTRAGGKESVYLQKMVKVE